MTANLVSRPSTSCSLIAWNSEFHCAPHVCPRYLRLWQAHSINQHLCLTLKAPCHLQLILLLRKCATSYILSDEKRDTLCDALAQLIRGLHTLDGPNAFICVDPAPGFCLAGENQCFTTPWHFHWSWSVVKKAVQELKTKLSCQEPGGGPVTELSIPFATVQLSSRICSQGLSVRETNQFTNEQIPVSDLQHIIAKHNSCKTNYIHSAKRPKGGKTH